MRIGKTERSQFCGSQIHTQKLSLKKDFPILCAHLYAWVGWGSKTKNLRRASDPETGVVGICKLPDLGPGNGAPAL